MRCKNEGKVEKKNFRMCYSGENKHGGNGLSEKVIQFTRFNIRIYYMKLSNKEAKVTLVNCYAPTN